MHEWYSADEFTNTKFAEILLKRKKIYAEIHRGSPSEVLDVLTYADECSLNTKCEKKRDCQYWKDNYDNTRDKPYCNLKKRGTYICCPVTPENYIQTKDEKKRVVRECASYQSVRPTCHIPLIVGGNKTEPKEFPFMALLSYFNGSTHNWLCGGTLISSKFILTAAHCFYVTNIPNNVRLGELDYSTTDEDARPTDYTIKGNATIHPEYNYITKFNDIALVELDREVEFNDYVMPACLPLVDGRAFDEFLAAGWGRIRDAAPLSSHLLKVKLDSFNDKTCLERLSDSLTVINTTIQMCAGSFSHERDTCTGDSGGPLFVNHPDYKCMFLILGVTSYSEGGCGNKNYPAFYTRVSSYVDWIEGIVWR